MRGRLKTHSMKTRQKSKLDRTQRSDLLNFPSISQNPQTANTKTRSFKPFAKFHIHFPSRKLILKPQPQQINSSSSNFFPNLERYSSHLQKGQINKNNFIAQNISTKNWCLYDSKRNKYLGFRQDYKRQIASLTKIMTIYISLYIVEQFKLSLNCKLRITKTSISLNGTSADLKQNLWISLEDLLYGVMLPSGNDAAYTLAQYLGYIILNFSNKTSEVNPHLSIPQQKIDLSQKNTIFYVQQFITLMNTHAKKMGLENTRFSNPHGLQNAMNVSSAKDIIMLSVQASKNNKFRQIMNSISWKYTLYESYQFRKKISKRWWNTNKLLSKDWQGIKTGHTSSAGGCLASLKQGIYIVVLNCLNSEMRFSDTQKIYNEYLKSYSTRYHQTNNDVINCKSKRSKTQFNQQDSLTTEDSI